MKYKIKNQRNLKMIAKATTRITAQAKAKPIKKRADHKNTARVQNHEDHIPQLLHPLQPTTKHPTPKASEEKINIVRKIKTQSGIVIRCQ